MFEKFISSLVYFYCLDEGSEIVLSNAGIDLSKEIPQDTSAWDVFSRFQDEAAKRGRKTAKFNLRDKLEILFRLSDLTEIPGDIPTLTEKFNSLKKEYQLQSLVKKAANNPNNIENIIKAFQQREAQEISWNWIENIYDEAAPTLEEKAKSGRVIVKVPKLEKLSEMIGGFNPKRISMLIGSTGFGKTNFALTLALRAREVMGVAYVNMEMSFEDMTRRMAVIETAITYQDFNRKPISSEIVCALNKYPKKFAMTNGRGMSIDKIKAWVKLVSQQTQMNMLIVDYDQKLEVNISRDTPEWKALQVAVEELEEFAKEMNLYVMLIAQANRGGDISGSFRAMFPAHTVLQFENNETHGPIIMAKKNRHGRKHQALKVLYSEDNSQIQEIEIITIDPSKPNMREL